jgi:Carboxypeptidase regulatory-like domain
MYKNQDFFLFRRHRMNRLSTSKFTSMVTMLAVVLLALSAAAFAQSIVTGDLTGTVTDPSGAVVSGAAVTLKSADTGSTQSTVTNSSGVYRFVLLKPGAYKLSVSEKSFKGASENVEVAVGQVNAFNIKLEIGSAGEIVEVVGGASLIENENANLTTTFSTNQLQSIPVPGGDITSYAYSAPGMVMNTAAGYGNFSAYGLPTTANLFTINGGDENDPYLNLNNSGASNLLLGSNELDQLAIVSNGYTGQYGRQSGAQINSTTKSGSNEFHGNAKYSWNGSKLNANDWFSDQSGAPKLHAVNNQYAASFGGPIKKGKAFFFADYEGLRFVLPGASGNQYLPTPAFASYVLANVGTTTPGSLPFYQNIFKLYAGAPGASRARPVTLNEDSAGGCGDFAGTATFGVANPCAMFFTSNQNNLNTEWLLATRIDYNFSDKDRLFGRYKMDRGIQATGTDPISPAFNAESIQPEYEGQINETHIFNGTTVNQLIFGGLWYKALFTANNLPAALAAFPTTMFFNDGLIDTLGGGDNAYPQGRIVSQYQITDDFSKSVGNHDFKFGVNFRRNLISDYTTGVNTSGALSINSMTEFVNGTSGGASDLSKTFTNVNAVRMKMYNIGVYAQDQWRASSKLSFTAALRIDRTGNPVCGSNCFTRLASPFATLSHDDTVPYNKVIQTGLKNAFPNMEKVVLAPRAGMTYSVTPNTVIRGGVGIFSDLFPGTLIDRFLTNAPNVATFDANTGAISPNVAGNLFSSDASSFAALQSGFASGATLASLQAQVPGFAPPAFSSAPNNVLNPKWVEYNLEVERKLGDHYSISANYVGNHGYDIMTDNPFANAYCKVNCPFGNTRSGIVGTLIPDDRFSQVRQLTNSGWSNYNGLTTSFKFRTKSLQAQFNYTWSHGMDTCSNSCLLPFSANTVVSLRYQVSPLLPGTSYGSSDYDVRHNITANYVYNSKADWSNGLMNHVIGGWTMAGTVYFHTGYPWSPVSTGVRNELGNVTGLRTGTPLADFAQAPSTFASCSNPNTPCATVGEFVASGSQGDFGNYARNTLRGPRFFDTDLSVMKNFKVGERVGFGLGASFYNILNHPNFDLPLNSVTGGGFGTIINTVSPATSPYGAFLSVPLTGRIIQLNGRFTF